MLDAYWAGCLADFRLQVDSTQVGSAADVRWDVCQGVCCYRANRDSCPVQKMVEKAVLMDGFGLDDSVASWVDSY